MSTIAPPHPIAWTVPGPLWDEPAGGGEAFRRPMLLRYATDRFMDAVTAELASADPGAIGAHAATPVSYRVRPPGRDPDWEPDGVTRPLKLFDAAHGHFNLVAASLVCQLPGLPERTVRTGDGDQVAFLLRRLTDAGGEEAWIPGGRWAPAPGARPVAGEERLPLFALPYTDPDGRARRVHVGVIPTSSVESSAQTPVPAGGATAADMADLRFRGEAQRVTDAYASLWAQEPEAAAGEQRDQQRAAVDMLLIDLGDLLARWFPGVHADLTAEFPPSGARDTLLHRLQNHRLRDGRTWASAIAEAWKRRDELLGETASGVAASLGLSVYQAAPEAGVLFTWLTTADREPDAPPPPDGAAVAVVPKYEAGARYVVRCAYLRPQCAPLDHDVISPRSDEFLIAGFFDADAPARPIHISLPLATGVKDLRSLRKAVNVELSAQLQNQMSRVEALGELIKGKKKAGLDIDIGLICSFSIPIITICALIVLMIFIALLNIVFFWLPLLRICLPFPRAKS